VTNTSNMFEETTLSAHTRYITGKLSQSMLQVSMSQ